MLENIPCDTLAETTKHTMKFRYNIMDFHGVLPLASSNSDHAILIRLWQIFWF